MDSYGNSPVVPADSILEASRILEASFASGGKLLICGNGGSAADSSHLAGELVKSYERKRPISTGLANMLVKVSPDKGPRLANGLHFGLPAISLASDGAVMSAISNDMGSDLVFAQQVIALGRAGDVLLCISTSGSSENVICAAVAAKAAGIKVIGLMGAQSSPLRHFCDLALATGAGRTSEIQSAHQRAYHDLCTIIESHILEASRGS